MSITAKVRKLIAHAESARSIGNIAEAEAFASKVQELLREHKLTMSDVEAAADPLGRDVASPRPGRVKQVAEEWSAKLASAIADACFCTIVTIARTNRLIFIGRDTDRAIAVSMWQHLHSTALVLAVDDCKQIAALRPRMHPLRIRSRYLHGFAHAIALRLARDRKIADAGTSSAGLIKLETAMEQVRDYQKATLQTRTVKIATVPDSLAFRTGFKRGIDAPLRNQNTLSKGAR